MPTGWRPAGVAEKYPINILHNPKKQIKYNTNNSQILNDIQSLQNLEQQLFSSLESNASLTTTQQQEIINKINDLSKMRINLYQTINGMNSYFQSALYNSRGTLDQQAAAIQIVENELNKSKRRLKTLEDTKNNKIRLVEINEYYGDKYAEHSQLMKIIIYTLIPMIVLTGIFNMGFLPSVIYYGLIVIISIIAGIFFWFRLWSIWSRDRMNYQAYDWKFNPNSVSAASGSASDPWLSSLGSVGTCVGNACCTTGMIYDENLDQCVIGNSTTGTTTSSGNSASSITNSLMSKMPQYLKPNVTLGDVNPNYSESFINYSKF